MIPFLGDACFQLPFILAFLNWIYGTQRDGKLSRNEISEIYSRMLPNALRRCEPKDVVPGSIYRPTRHSWLQRPCPRHSFFTPEILINLVWRCDKLGIQTTVVLDALGRRSLEPVQGNSAEADFHQYFLSFAKSLCGYLTNNPKRSATSAEKAFIIQILEAYLTSYIKGKPQLPTD